MKTPEIQADVYGMRVRARQNAAQGAVTSRYSAHLTTVLKRLNDALATELVGVLRYRRHHFTARGVFSPAVAAEFLVHSNEGLAHADHLAARMVQLGGEPDFSPDNLVRRSQAEYVEGATLAEMITENLVAERIAIDSHRDFIQYIGDQDPGTRRLLESILAAEEAHAGALAALLKDGCAPGA
ncbi:bacterioferritin [Pseudothauera lacus]|uniref:Bacterioferritin n=2 Tax=Pseudothauera lacus TaxID=2136175 RepID=A0A2T4IFN1_9RHOO|nr:bacterioferritin [Pseudothauera lacus]